MAKRIQSVSDAIAVLGGPRRIATYLGIDERAVPNWRERGFPAHTCVAMQDVFEQLNMTVDPELLGQTKPAVTWSAVAEGRARYTGPRRKSNGR